jgi:plasmid stabilization system protein ParE
MTAVRISPEAESELDEIWLYVAQASGSVEIASRVVDNITDRFWLLAEHPYLGRRRDEDLMPGLRSLAAEDYVILHRVENDGGRVVILHILHGSRDIAGFFSA